MSKQFEELSRNLAAGVSRRKAFLGFGAGIGAVIAGLLTGKRARADADCTTTFCIQACGQKYGFNNPAFGTCVGECVRQAQLNINWVCPL